MADPSTVAVSLDYPNDTLIRPNLLFDATASSNTTITTATFAAAADEAQYSTTTALSNLAESLSSALSFAVLRNGTWGNDSDTYNPVLSTVASGVWMDPCEMGNPQFNCSVLEFLEYNQGPQMMPFLKAFMVSRKSVAKSGLQQSLTLCCKPFPDRYFPMIKLNSLFRWGGGVPVHNQWQYQW